VTYDDWKTRDDNEPDPVRLDPCEFCGSVYACDCGYDPDYEPDHPEEGC